MNDVKSQFTLLKQLERENDEAQNELDHLMGELERVPAEQRPASEWGPNGIRTKRFLELSERQNEIAAEMKKLSKAIEKSAPSKTPN